MLQILVRGIGGSETESGVSVSGDEGGISEIGGKEEVLAREVTKLEKWKPWK